MLECPNCGSRNPDDALYCLRCRAPMYSAASPARRRGAPLLEERVPEREWEQEERWEEDEIEDRRTGARTRPVDRRRSHREWDEDEDERYAAYEDEDDYYYDDEYEDEYYEDERRRGPSAVRPSPLFLVLMGAILLGCGCLIGAMGGYFGGNLLASSGSGGGNAEEEIEAVVISYWEALGDGDFRDAYTYVAKASDVSRVDFVDEQEAMGDPSLRLVDVEVDPIEVRGKEAVVEVRSRWQAGDQGAAFVDTRDAELVREGRQWLIVWYGSEFPEPPPTPTPVPVQAGCPQGCLEPSENCQIKAIVAGDGRHLYYRPGDPAYDGSTVNTDGGGRWFCTEDEARAAGWVLAPQ